MSIEFKNCKFGVNLVDAARHELKFLEKVDNLHYLYDIRVVNEALRRYETLWLPLMKEYNGIIAAPIDIYWVWHVHMLCPTLYRKDIEQKLGKVLDHVFLTAKEYEEAIRNIKALWNECYPKENFDISDVTNPYRFVSNFMYDIESAASRQSSFYYQVSLPHYRCPQFLERCLTRYQMFLTLKKHNPDQCIVPCYDIDIIWHSHQLHPQIYAADTRRILGHVLPHDDSVNDRSPDSELTHTDSLTRTIWFTSFKKPFANDGSMFRGENSARRMHDVELAYLYAMLPKNIDLSMMFNTDITRQYKYVLRIYLTTHHSKDKCVCTYDYYTKSVEYASDIFTFCTHGNIGFKLKLFRKSGLCTMKLQFVTHLSTYQDFDFFSSSTIGVKRCYKLEILLNKKVFDLVTIGFTPKSVSISEIFLCDIIVGEFLIVSINVKDPLLWGATFTPNNDGQTYDGIMASHVIQNGNGQSVFDVNIIHSIKLGQSIVHVYSHDKILAIGNLIGKEQLPLIEKINSAIKYPTLCNKLKKRAMLIKDNKGDWVIVVANWNVNKTELGSCEYFEIELYCLRDNNRWIHLEIEIIDSFHFIIDDLFVNLATGRMELRSCENLCLLPNYICLVFVISVLYTLCKPKRIPTGDTIDNSEPHFEYKNNLNSSPDVSVIGKPLATSYPTSVNVKKTDKDENHSAPLLIASGYNYDRYIPSNSFFKHCVNSGGCAGCVGYNMRSKSVVSTRSVGASFGRTSGRFDCGDGGSEDWNDNASVEWD